MDKFCLLIISNRVNFLKNIFDFYKDVKFKIIIAHNIKKKIYPPSNENIKLIFIDEELGLPRTIKVLNKIEEKYLMLFSDDDFVFPEIIEKSVNFLENNPKYSNAHGLQLSFKVINKEIVSNKNILDYSLVNFYSDSKNEKIRLMQYFSNRYDDKLLSIMNKKLFLDIYKCFEPMQEKYSVAIEMFANVCICLSGRTKIFNEVGWIKRDHELNEHKITTLKPFDSMVLEKKFITLFKKGILKFCEIRNIKKNNIYFILLFMFLFRLKTFLKGKFRFIRLLFEIKEKRKKEKLKNSLATIYINTLKNLKKVEKILNL